MKEKSSNKILILLSVIIVGLFISSYFIYTDIKRKNEHIGSLNQEAAYQLKRNQYLLTLQRTFQNTDSDIARVNSSIIPSDGDIKFIDDLESTARADGLSINIGSLVFEDNPSLTSSGITNFKIRAETSGSWSSTYKFLAQIEFMPLKVRVNSFGLSGSLQSPSSGSKSSKGGSLWHSVFEINILKYK